MVLQLFSEFLRTINHTSLAGGMSVHTYDATHQEYFHFSFFQNQNILPPIIFANLHSATKNYPPDFWAAARRRQFNAIKGNPINTRRSTRNCSDKFSDYFPWRPPLLRLWEPTYIEIGIWLFVEKFNYLPHGHLISHKFRSLLPFEGPDVQYPFEAAFPVDARWPIISVVMPFWLMPKLRSTGS